MREGCIVGVCSCPRKGNRNVVTEVLASFPIPWFSPPCLSHVALVSSLSCM